MSDLFTLETPEIKGRNKVIFYNTVNDMPDNVIVAITPFTQRLRALGATLSEGSTERYMRFCRNKWNWKVNFIAQGKGKYLLKKEE
jgi:hypothetical protein